MSTIVTNPDMIIPTNRDFRSWNLTQIFVPGGAGGRYVPNKDDQVIEWAKDFFNVYQVTDSDFTTGRSTLELRYSMPRSAVETGRDIILSTAPGRPSDAYRALVDRSVKPHTITVDSRMIFLGSMAKYIKIFLGTDIGPNGEVISVMYDQSNTLLGENIPLEEVGTFELPNAGLPQGKSTAAKIAATGYTTRELVDNELLTVVAYADGVGMIVSETIAVNNTGHTRRPDSSRKYVTSINMDSPHISEGDDNVIRFPYNMQLDSVFGQCVVNYSDGTKAIQAIDGTKARLYGLNELRVSMARADLKFPVVLTYIPSKEEFYLGETIGDYRHISRRYTAITGPADAPYSAKIFGYPEWAGPLAGYRMRYFLESLARKKTYEITNFVRLGMNSPPFDGKAYGQVQHLVVTVDLNLVDSYYAPGTRFVQPVSVVLREDATNANTAWTVANDPDGIMFGDNLKVLGDYQEAGRYSLNIKMNAGSAADWLNKLFYAAGPIKNPEVESYTPEPTHFNLINGQLKSEHPIAAWQAPIIQVDVVEPGRLILFEWIRRTGNGDLILGMSAASYYQVD